MTLLSLSIPQAGLPNSTEDPKIASDLSAIMTWANGGIDATNLAPGSGIIVAPSAWTAPTPITNVTLSLGAAGRVEGNADVVRLRGVLINQTGGAIAAGATWATLASTLRPPSDVILAGVLIQPGTPTTYQAAAIGIAASTGAIVYFYSATGPGIGNNAVLVLEGLTYTK